MTQSIQQLRLERGAIVNDVRALMEKFPAAKWGEEQQSAYDEKMSQIEKIEAHIGRLEKLIEETEDRTDDDQAKDLIDRRARANRDLPETDPRRIFDTFLRKGEKGISDAQWAQIRNTMSTTTDAEGGFTVQKEVSSTLIDRLKDFGGIRTVADVFTTANGADMNYPTTDGTAEVGEIVAQNASATDLDPAFGTVGLNVYKYSSKVITVPFELLQDTLIDMEGFVVRRLAQRLGRITSQHFTTGTGTAQPRGVVTAAGSGKVGTTGQTTTIIYDDIIDLQHSVEPAYRALGNCRFMLNDALLKVIRKIKDTAGRPIFVPSYDAAIARGAPGEIAGSPYIVNNDMPVPAANAKSMLYGDFSNYKIRDVMAVTMFRFTDSAYTKKGQVGFLAWMRSGGNYVDNGDSMKFYQHSAT